MKVAHHLFNECLLRLFLARRYWFESLASLAALLLAFSGLLYTASVLSGVALSSEKFDGAIIGFALWMFAGAAYASTSNEVAEEIRQRTLEQLCLAQVRLWHVLFVRAAVNLIESALILFLCLLAIKLLDRASLRSVDVSVFGIALLAAPSLIGLGYAIAGILLLARKAEALQLLIYPCLIALVALPAYPANGWALLPFTYGAGAARAAATGAILSPQDYLLITANSAAWLIIGVRAFLECELRARRLGLMGHL